MTDSTFLRNDPICAFCKDRKGVHNGPNGACTVAFCDCKGFTETFPRRAEQPEDAMQSWALNVYAANAVAKDALAKLQALQHNRDLSDLENNAAIGEAWQANENAIQAFRAALEAKPSATVQAFEPTCEQCGLSVSECKELDHKLRESDAKATEEDVSLLKVRRAERELLRESVAAYLAQQSKPEKIKALWDLGNRI